MNILDFALNYPDEESWRNFCAIIFLQESDLILQYFLNNNKIAIDMGNKRSFY